MTRAELHAQYFNLICDQSSHQSSPETVGLQQAATLLRKMQAAIEGATHGKMCQTIWDARTPEPKCDCWKAPFL